MHVILYLIYVLHKIAEMNCNHKVELFLFKQANMYYMCISYENVAIHPLNTTLIQYNNDCKYYSNKKIERSLND